MSARYKNYRPTTAALTPEQAEGLRKLSDRTRVPQQVLIREAISDLLAKYARRRT